MDAPGLHRSRLTELALEGEDIIDADPVAQEITLDDAREAGSSPTRPSMESTAKFGHRIIGSATVFRRAS
ncbi:hypothetical protein [Streptomyces chartreusis]|uniref:hypothetical protein n=1 Tax=Streptomyces chartreusis TaxID=1969 RepID=UPI003634310D